MVITKFKISKLNQIIFWFFLLAFFADSANLDDFIPNTITYHADNPSLEFTDNILNIDIPFSQDNSTDFLSPKSDKLTSKHYAYDQDSPSLAAEPKINIHNSYLHQSETIVRYTSDIYSTQIYLLNCSLII